MPIIKQGNKEFIEITDKSGITSYYVHTINDRLAIGREGSYRYIKCPTCGKIVGTQFHADIRHMKTHDKPKKKPEPQFYYQWGDEKPGCVSVGAYVNDVYVYIGQMTWEEKRERDLPFHCPHP